MKKEIRFEEYKKWCMKHHKLPSQSSKDPIEKSLGNWRYQTKWDPLVEFNKQFGSRYKPKESRLEEYKKWCLENHRLPSSDSKDPIEKSLGNWRYQTKWDPLVEFNKQFGSRCKPKPKESRLEEYKKWCLENHRLPSKISKDPIEKSLGTWRCDHRNWEPLIEFNKQFESRCKPKPKESRFEEYKRWCIENQKLPSQISKDPTEKSLGTWRDKCRNWELLIEFNKQFELRCKPKEIRFEEYKRWCLEHNKFPSSDSKDPIEKLLGNWRYNYVAKNWEPLRNFNLILKKSVEGDEEATEIINLLR